MKRFIAVTLTGAVLMLTMATPARAGGERAIITLGIGLLTGAILGVAAATPQPIMAEPVGPPPMVYAPPPHQWVPGYWQDRWNPTSIQLQVSVPGYHDAYGNWHSGHYQTQVIQSGAWTRGFVPGHWE